jgi:hypothetical protein
MPSDPNFSIDASLIATGGDQSMPPSGVDPQQRVVKLNPSKTVQVI